MHTNPGHSEDDRPTGGASPVAAFAEIGTAFHGLMERALDTYLEAELWGGVAAATGLHTAEYLRLTERLPSWLVAQLESVAVRLDVLPECRDAFRDGTLTFDHLAMVVRETAKLNGEVLARVDAEIASLADALHVAGREHALPAEVMLLVEDLRAPGWANRLEKRATDGMSVTVQQDFDGGGFLGANLDAIGLPTVLTAIDALAPSDPDLTRRQARAHGLIATATAALGPDTGTGKPARPTMTVVVDIATATKDRFADVLRITGADSMPTLSARLTDALAENANLLIQLTNGRNPLAEIVADDTPAAVRRAVLARDKGCRFPACHRLATHIHHINGRNIKNPHDPSGLLGMCDHHHLHHIHKLRWHPTLDPATATVTWRRAGTRTLTTRPHATRRPKRDPEHLPDWLAPPRPPPPTGEPPGLGDPPPES